MPSTTHAQAVSNWKFVTTGSGFGGLQKEVQRNPSHWC